MYKTGIKIDNFLEIAQILNASDTLHIAFHDDPYPYIIPLSYGFDVVEEELVIYVFINKESRANALIKKNPFVAIESEILYNYFETPYEMVSCSYDSIMAHGKMEELDRDQYDDGLDFILTHCGYEGFIYNEAFLDDIVMYKIVLEDVSGRRCLNRNI
ncbi:MAG: pyridoxamine 5'-phosphate oxidase family protein [Erysipelotrichaceae bacterium]|nr:pyridoxamine 5'-phosphate oxidase family protein [Erysipelotrichaceae bacterium]